MGKLNHCGHLCGKALGIAHTVLHQGVRLAINNSLLEMGIWLNQKMYKPLVQSFIECHLCGHFLNQKMYVLSTIMSELMYVLSTIMSELCGNCMGIAHDCGSES